MVSEEHVDREVRVPSEEEAVVIDVDRAEDARATF